MTLELAGIVIYVMVQLAIGVAASRRIHSEAGYLLADRSLGYGLAGFSLFATWLGAETCIGSAGEVYASGLSGTSAEPFAYGACLLLMGVVFATPLWKRGYTTVADLFRDRFSVGVERLVVVLVVPTSVFWAAAQLRAFGQVLSASAEIALPVSIGLAAGIAVIYTCFGGLLADSVTDLVQGVALTVGLLVLAVTLVGDPAAADWLRGDPVGAMARASEESLAAGMGPVGQGWLDILEAWSVPIFGSVMAQEIVSRVLGSRSAQVARRAAVSAAFAYVAIGIIPVIVGLVGARALPGLDDPEQLLLLFARDRMPGLLYIVFAGAIISAILSTVDSTLLAASSLTAHNLIVSLRPELPDRTRLRIARASVVVFGAAAFAMALYSGGVLELVETASAFGSAGVFVAGSFGLFGRFGGPASATAALLAGAIVWLWSSNAEVATPYLISLAAAFAAYVGVACVEKQPAASIGSQIPA